MYHYGRLAVLGLQPASIPDNIYSLLFSEGIVTRLEAYKERLDRAASSEMTPERAYQLVYQTFDGTIQERMIAASQAMVSIHQKK